MIALRVGNSGGNYAKTWQYLRFCAHRLMNMFFVLVAVSMLALRVGYTGQAQKQSPGCSQRDAGPAM